MNNGRITISGRSIGASLKDIWVNVSYVYKAFLTFWTVYALCLLNHCCRAFLWEKKTHLCFTLSVLDMENTVSPPPWPFQLNILYIFAHPPMSVRSSLALSTAELHSPQAGSVGRAKALFLCAPGSALMESRSQERNKGWGEMDG